MFARVAAAEFVLVHLAYGLPLHRVGALADDHVLVVAAVHPRKLSLVLLSPLRSTAVVLFSYDLLRRVCRLQTAEATHVLRLRALPLLRAADPHRVFFFHAQLLLAIRLTRALLWPLERRDRFCRAGQARLQDRPPRLMKLCHRPVPGCLPHVRRRESAVERSWDFRL